MIALLPPSLQGDSILLRVDLNVPLEKGLIIDDFKIRAILPTLKTLFERGARRIILISHLGRPHGKDPSLSLKPIAIELEKLWQAPLLFTSLDDFPFHTTAPLILLENCRFEEDTPDLAKRYARLGTFYVNDAFACSHRQEPTTMELALLFPQKRAIGLLMQKELEKLTPILNLPKEKKGFIIGGAKLSTKCSLIDGLCESGAWVAIGGLLARPFLGKKKGVDPEEGKLALSLLKKHSNILLPIDLIGEKGPLPLNSEEPFFDIGLQTIASWTEKARLVDLVFWNGPLGYFEKKPFNLGTLEMARSLSQIEDLQKIAGGGETVAALQKSPFNNSFYLSTGGGALLEFIEKKGHLPVLELYKT